MGAETLTDAVLAKPFLRTNLSGFSWVGSMGIGILIPRMSVT